MVDVTLNLASSPSEQVLVLVKLQAPAWELNFRATPEELVGLSSIRKADWATRRCLHIGESAGARALVCGGRERNHHGRP